MYSLCFENEDFLVIYKQPGASFHQQDGAPGVFAALRQSFSASLYAVHRLDRVTSGLLLAAKSEEVARQLSLQFASHAVEKYYLALADRKPRKKQGLIMGDMTRSRRGAWKLLPTRHNPAATQFFSKSIDRGVRLFVLRPLTGKTHQLRVAMKSLGAPVLGDPLYHQGNKADRTYLHAYAIRFWLREKPFCFVKAPLEGKLFESVAFQKGMSEYAAPWELNWPQSGTISRLIKTRTTG